MSGSVNRIEQDIKALEEAIARIAQEFEQAYQQYLTSLGQAVRQQLTLATYHLCTQGYPEAFLQLSFSERQRLQQGLRNLGKQAQASLLTLVSHPSTPEPLPNQNLLSEDSQELEETEEEETEETQEVEEAEFLPAEDLSLLPEVPAQPLTLTPEVLLRWQDRIEKGIGNTLQTLSHNMNLLLQRSGILSKKLPEKVLEVASKAEAAGEGIAGPPNLLNLMIETEDTQDSQSSTITRLTAVHLRLGEIEFADANVMSGRHHIRHLMGQLSTLRRDYQKKLRERAIVEAESAWRSSWFED